MPANTILNLYWSPDSSTLFIPSKGDRTYIWRPKESDSKLEPFAADMDFMDFSDDGDYLYFTREGDLHIWRTQPYRPLHRVTQPFTEDSVLLVFTTWTPNRVLVLGWYDVSHDPQMTSRLWIYDTDPPELLFTLEHPACIHTPSLKADGRTLFCADGTNRIYVRDTADAGAPVTIWKSAWLDEVSAWKTPHYQWWGEKILGFCEVWKSELDRYGYRAAVWHPNTDAEERFDFDDIEAIHDHFGWAKDKIRVQMDNADDEPHVRVWNPASKQVYMEFDIDVYESPAVALSPDGTLLARIEGEAITLYDVQTGNLLRKIDLDF